MPIPKPCLDCGAKTNGGSRCDQHEKNGWPTKIQGQLPPGWARTRRTILQQHPICQGCGNERSTTVDHIIARAFGGSEDRSNLQALGPQCAREKDARDRARGRSGQ